MPFKRATEVVGNNPQKTHQAVDLAAFMKGMAANS
jgi:hypothetical protein